MPYRSDSVMEETLLRKFFSALLPSPLLNLPFPAFPTQQTATLSVQLAQRPSFSLLFVSGSSSNLSPNPIGSTFTTSAHLPCYNFSGPVSHLGALLLPIHPTVSSLHSSQSESLRGQSVQLVEPRALHFLESKSQGPLNRPQGPEPIRFPSLV